MGATLDTIAGRLVSIEGLKGGASLIRCVSLPCAALLALSIASSPHVRAAEPAKQEQSPYECRWAAGPIEIDGDADEPAWREAALLDKFMVHWNKDGPRPPRTATRARLLWDRDNLYFFADMDDADLFADVTEQDGAAWTNDVFELFFKPSDDRSNYYEFEVNAANAILDMHVPARGRDMFLKYGRADAFHLETKVALRGTLNMREDTDRGWSVEGRIPWSDFVRTGGRPEAGSEWRFSLCRYDYSLAFDKPELSSSAPLTAADYHRYEDYAPVRFIGANK